MTTSEIEAWICRVTGPLGRGAGISELRNGEMMRNSQEHRVQEYDLVDKHPGLISCILRMINCNWHEQRICDSFPACMLFMEAALEVSSKTCLSSSQPTDSQTCTTVPSDFTPEVLQPSSVHQVANT